MNRTLIATRRLPYELRVFCGVTAISTAATWLIMLGAHVAGSQYTLFIPNDRWHDYWGYFSRLQFVHRSNFFTAPGYAFSYMAPGVPLYRFFYQFGLRGGLVVYLVVAGAAILFGLVRVRRAMLRRGIRAASVNGFLLLLLVASYPIAFCIDRGNLEIVLATGLALGTWAYWNERTWTAAILWGVFGSVKLYPLILAAIFLSFRQYRQFCAAIGAAVLTTVLSLYFIGPDLRVTSAGIWMGLGVFVQTYGLRIDHWIGFDHSLYALLKLASILRSQTLGPLLHGYLWTAAGAGLLLYFVRIRKLPAVNQLLLLSICSILLPPTSADYTLIELYAPFIALVFVAVEAAHANRKIAGLLSEFILLALLFTPTNFLFAAGISLGAQLKCLMLLALAVLALRHSFSSDTECANHLPTPAIG